MGNETLLEKLKSIIYKIILPIYLWSIGYKTLEDYITALENEFIPKDTHKDCISKEEHNKLITETYNLDK